VINKTQQTPTYKELTTTKVISMDRGGKCLSRDVTKYTRRGEDHDQAKMEESGQTEKDESGKRKMKTQTNKVNGYIIG